jgi:hypothetical protein
MRYPTAFIGLTPLPLTLSSIWPQRTNLLGDSKHELQTNVFKFFQSLFLRENEVDPMIESDLINV